MYEAAMTDRETATCIREWIARDKEGRESIWSWPTDPCGYEQHIRFVQHRNTHWNGGSKEDWWTFCEKYAATLE